MNRIKNPYNIALKNSKAFMMLFSKYTNATESEDFLRTFSHTNYEINYSKKGNGIVFSVSHEFIDGEGLKNLPNFIKFPPSNAYPINCEFIIDGYQVKYFSRKLYSRKLGDKSYTQHFIQDLINSNLINNKNIGIVVKLFNSDILSPRDLIGNSIAINLYPQKYLHKLCHLNKQDWKENLIKDAKRLIRVMAKKSLGDSGFDSFVISSMGNMNNRDGFNCIYGATPISPRYINVFLWFSDNREHMVLCSSKNHKLINLPVHVFNSMEGI